MSTDFSTQVYAAFTDEIIKIAGAKRIERIAMSMARKLRNPAAEGAEAKLKSLGSAFERQMGKHQRRGTVSYGPEKEQQLKAVGKKLISVKQRTAKAKTPEQEMGGLADAADLIAKGARIKSAKPTHSAPNIKGKTPATVKNTGMSAEDKKAIREAQARVDRQAKEDDRIRSAIMDGVAQRRSASTSTARRGGGGSTSSATASSPPTTTPAAQPKSPQKKNNVLPALALTGAAGAGLLHMRSENTKKEAK